MTIVLDRMFKLANDASGLGLACTSDGLTLAGVPLLRNRTGQLEARPWPEVRHLMGQAYSVELEDTSLCRGLQVVAAALNTGDLALAMTASVLLKLPELDWNGAVRIARADDSLRKYNFNPDQPRDWRGWWTIDDNDDPRNPMWPAPVDPSPKPLPDPQEAPHALPKDWVHLTPGLERNDELADLAEWVANAKPSDAATIQQEISRYFDGPDEKDPAAANAFRSALTDALNPGTKPEDRQKILQGLDFFTFADRGERTFGIAFSFEMLITALAEADSGSDSGESAELGEFAMGGARSLRADAEIASLEAKAEAQVAQASAAGAEADLSFVWSIRGWATRGNIVEKLRGATLPHNFPVIDKFLDGVATSIKSLDLNAAVYQDTSRLTYRINNYVDKVAAFDGARWGKKWILAGETTSRELDLVIPKSAVASSQHRAIEAAIERAKSRGVNLIVTRF
jgi:hypothetical protein